MTIVVATTPDEAAEHTAAWDRLASSALEPNVFYEPWMLLPAWRTFGGQKHLTCFFVYGPDAVGFGPDALYGVFMMERHWLFRGLPLPTLRTWRHIHCFLGTPLVHSKFAISCIEELFAWLKKHNTLLLVEFNGYRADGPFQKLLAESAAKAGLPLINLNRHNRALLHQAGSSEASIEQATSARHRSEFRRLRKRLSERGRIEFRTLDAGEDLSKWVSQFLELEARGWKGRRGTALKNDPPQHHYFVQIAHAAHKRGRLMMMGLYLDGRPLAIKCDFIAPPGSFGFKMAYDEELAQFSPGGLLLIESIRVFHDRQEVEWTDSCACGSQSVVSRMWRGRREICTTTLSNGRWPSNLALLVLSGLQLFYKLSRRLMQQIGH